MATSLPIGGKIVLTPSTPTASVETFLSTDIIFGSAVYRETGNDVEATTQDGNINRYRKSINYEVTFETWGDDSDEGVIGATTVPSMLKTNTKCETFKDDGTTALGTTFYGTVKRIYSESSETTSWTIAGNTVAIPG